MGASANEQQECSYTICPQVDPKAEHISLPLLSNLLCLVCIAAHPACNIMRGSLVTLLTISHILAA